MRFDVGETYQARCSKPRCRNRPDYHYSFEVFSKVHGEWQQRDYFYCAAHMDTIAGQRGLELPVLTVSEVSVTQNATYP